MRKIRGILMIMAACCLVGCSRTEEKEEIANPMVEVESAQAFVKLGANIEVPAGAQNAKYYIVNDEVAEIQFSFNDADYSYRASRTQKRISGVYGKASEEREVETGEGTVIVKEMEEGGYLTEWTFDPVSYSLYTADEVEAGVVESLVRELVNGTSQPIEGSEGDLTA